jgi:hypothetical protein
MRAPHRIVSSAFVATLVLALTACSASTTTTPTVGGSASSSPGGNGGRATVFAAQLNWTGSDPVQGPLTVQTFASSETCSQSASDAFDWNLGFGPDEGAPATVGGILINVLINVPQAQFHGPGTYSNVVRDLSVASDDFSGMDSTLTINANGSGNASFTNLASFAGGLTESGTVTWTCSD